MFSAADFKIMINFDASDSWVNIAINYVFSLIWTCYGPKWDILDYWGTIIFCLLSYYILLKDKGL